MRLSILNVSSRDFNMSRFEFGPDIQHCEIKQINGTIEQLAILANQIREKHHRSETDGP